MRDKENRRDIVYFLYNRLHHFELFNGIPITTLFSRVSCGRDYIEDLIDSDSKSPFFPIFPRHMRTISDKKNLDGLPKPRSRSRSPLQTVVLSPFSLNEGAPESPPQGPPEGYPEGAAPHDSIEPPSETPPFFKRASQNAAKAPLSPFRLSSPQPPETDRRVRSMSMFERIASTTDPGAGSAVEGGEERKEGTRSRTYSVHDVILQEASHAVEIRCCAHSQKSMFTNAVLSPQSAQAAPPKQAEKEASAESALRPLQKTPAPLIGPGKEGQARKPLFGKPARREGGSARLVEEISKMNGLLDMIAKNQRAMQVGGAGSRFALENAGRTGEEGGPLYAGAGLGGAGEERWLMSFIECLLQSVWVVFATEKGVFGFNRRSVFVLFSYTYNQKSIECYHHL